MDREQASRRDHHRSAWQIVARYAISMAVREVNPSSPLPFLRLLSRFHPFIGRVPLYTRARLTENI